MRPSLSDVVALLKRAAEAIETEHDDSEGQRMGEHVVCPVCDGAVPTEHSLLCDIKEMVRKVEAK